jgi:hypothetical protein
MALRAVMYHHHLGTLDRGRAMGSVSATSTWRI